MPRWQLGYARVLLPRSSDETVSRTGRACLVIFYRVTDAPEAVVILGAQVYPSGRPSPSLRRRAEHAVEVARRFPDSVLVASGGSGDAPISEAEAMRRIAIDAGFPDERIVLEDRSTSTLEHARFVSAMAGQAGWRTLCLVTDRYHLPRARFLFRRFGLSVTGDPVRQRGDASFLRWLVNGYGREIPAWGKNLVLVALGRHRLPGSNL